MLISLIALRPIAWRCFLYASALACSSGVFAAVGLPRGLPVLTGGAEGVTSVVVVGGEPIVSKKPKYSSSAFLSAAVASTSSGPPRT